MNNKLNDLITYYEEEKNRLLGLLNEYVNELDYIAAHHSSNALAKVNYQLSVFYNLNDKLHNKKENLLLLINSYEGRVESGISEFEQEFYLKIIQQKRAELDKLNQPAASLDSNKDESLLDQALFKLIDRKIKYFNLVLIRSKNFYFKFKFSKKQFVISLDNIKRHLKNYVIYEDQLKSLECLGFEFSKNQNKLTLFVPSNASNDINPVKVILIKIVFEIFHFSEFRDASYIEYKEKT